MNDKNFEDDEIEIELPPKPIDTLWKFCPRCGNRLPSVDNIRFCMQCGFDIQYFKQYKSLPSTIPLTPFDKRIKLNDDELIKTKKKKLWGIFSSFGLPILSFILIEVLILVIALIIIIPLIFTMENPSELLEFLTSPSFISIATIAELIFFFIPIWYVGRYIQHPTFNNRIKLLGIFNNENKDNYILKEVLIGLLFAVSAYFIVNLVSILTDLTFGAIFGPEFLERAYGSAEGTGFTTDMLASNILELILMIVMMILIVGPSEEIIFRGFTQKGWDRHIGQKWALICTAIFFTFFHVIPILMPTELFLLLFPPYFVISLMLGAVYIWRKENLIACIVGHGVYNAVTISIAFLFF